MTKAIHLKIPKSVWEYPLDEHSIIFIIGAYSGKTAQYFMDRHNPFMFLFEPQKKLASELMVKFKDNPRVSVFPFGLGERNFRGKMSQYGLDGASFVPMLGSETGGRIGKGKVREIGAFMGLHHVKSIDLCVMNCEGYEWRLLPWIIKSNIIQKIRYLMVQFHIEYEGQERMQEIRDMISLTHTIKDDHWPVWVSWFRRKA